MQTGSSPLQVHRIVCKFKFIRVFSNSFARTGTGTLFAPILKLWTCFHFISLVGVRREATAEYRKEKAQRRMLGFFFRPHSYKMPETRLDRLWNSTSIFLSPMWMATWLSFLQVVLYLCRAYYPLLMEVTLLVNQQKCRYPFRLSINSDFGHPDHGRCKGLLALSGPPFLPIC